MLWDYPNEQPFAPPKAMLAGISSSFFHIINPMLFYDFYDAKGKTRKDNQLAILTFSNQLR